MAIGNGFARFAYALLLPAMRSDLGWSYTEAGWLNTANALGYVLGSVSGYALLRSHRPSELFKHGLLLTVGSLALTGASATLGWLTLTRIVAGVGAAWMFACGGALVAARYQAYPELRGSATGLFFAGAGVGISASGLLIYPVLELGGNEAWPIAWLVLGLASALLAFWPWIEAGHIWGLANRSDNEKLDLRGLTPAMIAYFLFATGYIVYMTFIFAWIRVKQMSPEFGTLVWIVLGLGVMASGYVWRRALDTWNPMRTLAASCMATFVGSLIPLCTSNAVGIVLSAGLFGVAVFIAPSAITVLSRRIMQPGQWAKTITLFTVLFSIGQSIGPVLAGWVADHYSLNSCLILGVVVLATAAIVALLPSARVAQAMKQSLSV